MLSFHAKFPHERDISSSGTTNQQANELANAQVGGPPDLAHPTCCEKYIAPSSTWLQVTHCSKQYVAPSGTLLQEVPQNSRCTRRTLLQVHTSGRPTHHREAHGCIHPTTKLHLTTTYEHARSHKTKYTQDKVHTTNPTATNSRARDVLTGPGRTT